MAVQTAKLQNLGGSQILYNDLRKRAASADGNLADEYSASKTYAVGDFVVYLDKLYTCKTAITTPEAWTAAHWEETSMGDDVTELKKEMPEKADRVGVYPDLTSGTAEQLASTQYVENAEAYKHRATGGSADVGNREYLEKIVGGTVCWNQLYPAHTKAGRTIAGLTVTFENGWMNVSGTVEEMGGTSFSPTALTVPQGHVALTIADKKGIDPRWGRVGYGSYVIRDYQFRRDNNQDYIGAVNVYFDKDVTYEGSIRFATYDLTAIFGSEIATYIYNLDSATPGAGFNWFRKYFPNNYYEHNPGELISVSGLQSHDTVGFNAWDEEWEPGVYNTNTGKKQSSTTSIRSKNLFKVIPGARYSLTKPTTNQIFGLFYDESGQLVVYVRKDGDTGAYNSSARFALASAKATFTVPAGATQMSLRMDDMTVYNHDICVHLVHSGTRDGEYEPYEKHSYPLDSSVVLLGVPKLDENGNLYFDGDEYASDGQVSRKYGFLLDMGTLNWSGSSNRWSANIPTLSNKAARTAHMMCSRYPALFNAEGYPASGEKVAYCGLHNVYVHDDSYSSVAEFKSAMSGVMLVYELDTPVTETAEPYTEIQVCSDWGTEEFVSDSILPVGHLTRYPANLRDKLQHLPSLAESDGDYIVRQTGSQMSLVGLGDTAEVAGIKNDISELRATASAQGIYVETESKPIVSISDGADDQPMKSVKVAIEPVQDLHGYEYPWPAGGGKNLLPGTPATATSKGCTLTYDNGLVTFGGTATGDGGRTVLKTTYFSLKAGTYTFKEFNRSGSRGNLYLQNGTEYFVMLPPGMSETTFTLETDYNTFNIGLNVSTGITYEYSSLWGIFTDSEVTEWTPYSNVCPISGWTGAKVTRTGKNLFDIGLLNLSPVTVVDGVATGTSSNFASVFKNGIPNLNIPKNTQLTLSFDAKTDANAQSTGNGLILRFVYSDGTRDSVNIPNSVTDYERFTLTSDASKVVSNLVFSYSSSGQNIWHLKNIQLEIGSTASDYEPYLGQTYEVTFPADPGTVYGGTLDVASGKLVVDRATVVLDGATESWSAFTSAETGNDFRFRTNGLVGAAFGQGINGTQKADWLATTTGYTTSGASPIVKSIRQSMTLFGNQNRLYVYVPDIVSNESDIDGWKAYLAQHPLTVSYLLATPQEITLTPTEIKTLLGLNNVWADAGNTSITYPADTKTYIDNRINSTRKLIAGIETGFVASKPYAVGDMLIIEDDLYKVASSIASGATITVGTNVTKTTVAEQLLALANA